ncbi:hypothetical protein HMPREF1367_02669 [Enterococcus faecium ERV38]|nr:hypothetical protein HMPREF1367_02669 [Enterococcus faecium ERV38]
MSFYITLKQKLLINSIKPYLRTVLFYMVLKPDFPQTVYP